MAFGPGDFHISAPFCRTVAYQNNFFHRCISCWSNLPSTFTSATSLKQFRNALARVDLTNYLQYRYFNSYYVFLCAWFLLRRHVSGVFMPCERRGVHILFLTYFLYCIICSPKFLNK